MMPGTAHKVQKSGSNTEKSNQRTPRACDRCRLKKAKCDGGVECETCRVNQSRCVYTARRGREARKYYLEMREVMEEALHRLYWACRDRSGYPGTIPVEHEQNEPVTTTDILASLGLSATGHDELTSSQEASVLTSSLPFSEQSLSNSGTSTQSPVSAVTSPSEMKFPLHPPPMPPAISHGAPFFAAPERHDGIPSRIPLRAATQPAGIYGLRQIQPQATMASMASMNSLPASLLDPEGSMFVPQPASYPSQLDSFGDVDLVVNDHFCWTVPGPSFNGESYDPV
ncbi:hypothetical protein A1O1_07807 [Capronia coronata CBS 617.96]|uniref:Zn(2)-C6 fungal-type domain-containing protein n=1 Tax=Capronia coronata CBS 617.96 TaxID=1182541 RepID=W9XMH5_9EURO|nr:uncharacterized protein A1O1_07807 [Capronia coronata CBS 617.96]EXJ81742.1 hypothetical protein A1O1_07807 [Capronia coronata CBS 617.96]